MPTKRLFFIDALRAIAILMMLQGHFVYSLLNENFKDESSIIYNLWRYFRGNTAPIFFTVTGFVFIYLLLKKQDEDYINHRVKKGIKRAFQVLFWAYIIRFNFYMLLGYGLSEFIKVDVLNVIAISILMLIGIYKLFKNTSLQTLQYAFLVLGIIIFLFKFWYEGIAFTYLPRFLANYLDMNLNIGFNIFPWFGYVCFGAFLAIHFIHNKIQSYKKLGIQLIVYGAILLFGSSIIFKELYNFTGIDLFMDFDLNNYLFMRLGNVFITVAFIMLLEPYFKNKTLLTIGQKTLTVYIIHFVLLYGSWFGLGLNTFLNNSLGPWSVFIGAIIFMIVVCYFTIHLDKFKQPVISWINSKLSDKFKKRLAKLRIRTFL